MSSSEPKVRIVSDGTPLGTRVFYGETEIRGIRRIDIGPIVPTELVSATLHFDWVHLDLTLKDGALLTVSADTEE